MPTRAPARKPTRSSTSATPPRALTLLVGTSKGGFALDASADRKTWRVRGPFLLGARTHDLRSDPRGGRTWLMSSTGGHLGPTIYRSTNAGRAWKEAALPPRFDKADERAPADSSARASIGHSVKTNFWLEPGHASEPGVWYCGTSPQGLFRSDDDGDTWCGVDGWNHHPNWSKWVSAGSDGTPDGPVLHSIHVDPRDARHICVSCSSGGTFESRDKGSTWRPLNAGIEADFLPSPGLEYGHDPHCMLAHPADPDRWYQQNHCGIYRLDRAIGEQWTRIGKRMPKAIGDIGFPIATHPADRDTVWVIPMDGRTIWPRTSPGGKPAAYVTRDGGKSWKRRDQGLPREHAYWTVLRQAFAVDAPSACDARSRVGLYFGTTSGEIWGSLDSGASWSLRVAHLPRIYSLRVASAVAASSRTARSATTARGR